MSGPIRIVITCSGGLVRTVYAEAQLQVFVVDWDEYEHDAADSEIETDSAEEARRIAYDIVERVGEVVHQRDDLVQIDRDAFPFTHLCS